MAEGPRFRPEALQEGYVFDKQTSEIKGRIDRLVDGVETSNSSTFDVSGSKLNESPYSTRGPNFGESAIFNKQCEEMVARMRELAEGLSHSRDGTVDVESNKLDQSGFSTRGPNFGESTLFNRQTEAMTSRIHSNYMNMVRQTSETPVPPELRNVMKTD